MSFFDVPAQIFGTIYNNRTQKEINDQNVDFQRQTNAQNLAFQEKWNQANMNFAQSQFDEQKFLNRNQYQLAAADMQAAGINPAMASGGVNLSAGSYSSGTNNQSNLKAPVVESPYLDLTWLSGILDRKLQKELAKDKNQTDKDIARDNNQTQEDIADKQIASQQEMLTSRLTQEDRQFAEKLRQDFSIATIQAELQRRGLEQQEAIEKAKRVSEQLQRNDDFQKAMKQIELEEQRIKDARTKAERDAAVNSANGWKSFFSSIVSSVINGAATIVSSKSRKR